MQSDSFPVFGQDRGKLGTHKCDGAFDQKSLSDNWVRFHDRYGKYFSASDQGWTERMLDPKGVTFLAWGNLFLFLFFPLLLSQSDAKCCAQSQSSS